MRLRKQCVNKLFELSLFTHLRVNKCNHSIFRHDNFIGCFSADKIVVAENSMLTTKCLLYVR